MPLGSLSTSTGGEVPPGLPSPSHRAQQPTQWGGDGAADPGAQRQGPAGGHDVQPSLPTAGAPRLPLDLSKLDYNPLERVLRSKALGLLPPGGAVLRDRSCIVPVPGVAILVIRLETVQRLNSAASPLDLFRVMRLLGLIVERACVPRGGLRVRVKQYTITTVFGLNKDGHRAGAKDALARTLRALRRRRRRDSGTDGAAPLGVDSEPPTGSSFGSFLLGGRQDRSRSPGSRHRRRGSAGTKGGVGGNDSRGISKESIPGGGAGNRSGSGSGEGSGQEKGRGGRLGVRDRSNDRPWQRNGTPARVLRSSSGPATLHDIAEQEETRPDDFGSFIYTGSEAGRAAGQAPAAAGKALARVEDDGSSGFDSDLAGHTSSGSGGASALGRRAHRISPPIGGTRVRTRTRNESSPTGSETHSNAGTNTATATATADESETGDDDFPPQPEDAAWDRRHRARGILAAPEPPADALGYGSSSQHDTGRGSRTVEFEGEPGTAPGGSGSRSGSDHKGSGQRGGYARVRSLGGGSVIDKSRSRTRSDRGGSYRGRGRAAAGAMFAPLAHRHAVGLRALRALMAGSDTLRSLQRLSRVLGLQLNASVAVHTGTVVLGLSGSSGASWDAFGHNVVVAEGLSYVAGRSAGGQSVVALTDTAVDHLDPLLPGIATLLPDRHEVEQSDDADMGDVPAGSFILQRSRASSSDTSATPVHTSSTAASKVNSATGVMQRTAVYGPGSREATAKGGAGGTKVDNGSVEQTAPAFSSRSPNQSKAPAA